MNYVGYCGNYCYHCYYEECAGCRSDNACCSYGTLFADNVCPNVACCKEKGIEGCYACDELRNCTVGFFGSGENDAKAYARFVQKYGKEAYIALIPKMNEAGHPYPQSLKEINDADAIFAIMERVHLS